MSKVALIAKLTSDPANAAEVEAALAATCEAAAEEAGLEIYSAHKDTGEDGVYWFFELYTDGEALAVHGKGDGMRAAMGALGGLLTSKAEISMLSPVAAQGMEL